MHVIAKHHDLIAVSVNDPREIQIPDVGRLVLEDTETGELVEIDTGNAAVRARYQEQAAGRRQAVSRALRSLGVDLLQFENGADWMPELIRFFETRRKRAV
jgi:uncharacterized protein (DUF58 family)